MSIKSILATGDNFDHILFKIAIYFAKSGRNVWFISPETFENIPDDIKPPNKEVLQLITFLYLKDYKDFIRHLNGVHLWHKTPTMIIVSKFEIYCNSPSNNHNPLQGALAVTSLLDGAAACASKTGKNVFILTTSVEFSNIQTIKHLYFPENVSKTSDGEFFDKIVNFFR